MYYIITIAEKNRAAKWNARCACALMCMRAASTMADMVILLWLSLQQGIEPARRYMLMSLSQRTFKKITLANNSITLLSPQLQAWVSNTSEPVDDNAMDVELMPDTMSRLNLTALASLPKMQNLLRTLETAAGDMTTKILVLCHKRYTASVVHRMLMLYVILCLYYT